MVRAFGDAKYGGIGVAVAEKPDGPYRDLLGRPLIDHFWNGAQPIDQYVFECKGRWYFMYSSGSWTLDDYCVCYSVGDSPFGPFTFKGKVLGVQRPIATGAGHHSVICVPGTDDWLICYHRRPVPNEGRDHRVVCVDRMEFDEAGDIKPVVMTK